MVKILAELIIENFAIIDKVDLKLDEGMTVLTGETGAGKSIIIDALSMLVGGRANSGMIRLGAQKAVLQAIFDLNHPDGQLLALLSSQGIAVDDAQLIISREFNLKGRNTIRINGMVVNLKTLAQVGRYLVDIQGQHDTQRLLDADEHLPLLDQYAGEELMQVKRQYQGIFKQFKQLNQQINDLKHNQQATNQRLDLLRFQQEELSQAALKAGEEDELLEQRAKLHNFKKIADSLQLAQEILNGNSEISLVDQLGTAKNAVDTASGFDGDYQNLNQTLTDSYYAMQEASRDLNERLDSLSFDENDLLAIDDRLQLIHQLERKYGNSVAEILAYQRQVEKELDDWDSSGLDLGQLTEKKAALKEQVQASAKHLHQLRQAAGEQLAQEVNQQLADLLMNEALFEVHLTPIDGFLPSGNDQVSFHVRTNLGEAMGPLVKIASGGEASRLMLALKTALIAQEPVETVVFDEIDTGVSGRVAGAIASKMLAIAQRCQVLAITHLPQVAAAADHHYYIEKQAVAKRTITQVELLDEPGRQTALARMLSGDQITEAALENARALRQQ
ncbi:DNA replication and repair protein RecN [Leuconostocaceae bacterium R-53105]|uniref:DNA repair protein RecN n=1 Tax=Convivina intestini TaxID=1505726 RepID=A0A2U1DCB8_9LACO|nr:DNA replication and repair protein RecN [Convivina intestini]CAH1852847.1 DNA repair protein RecN [Convivina intestini]SDB86388.1 DNA replication and repair protein RecN [Leuconostocaceae bacterium R-53105]